MPNIAGDQVTRLNFGAINHRATLWVDGQEVATQVTAYTNSVFDITDYVRPGKPAQVTLLVKGRKALVGPDGRYTVPEGASWSDDVAQGIFRSADLEVFPAVYISDTVVRTSVVDRTLSYDVYLTNATSRPQRAELKGDLKSWNRARGGTRASGTGGDGPGRHHAEGHRRTPHLARRTDSYWWPTCPTGRVPRPAPRARRPGSTPRERAMQSSGSEVRFGFRELGRWATTTSSTAAG